MPWQDVGLSVRLSVTRRYSVETAKHVIKDFHRLVAADHSSFSTQNGMAILRRGHPNGGVECKGVWKNHDFWSLSRFVSETMQDRAVVTIEGEQETAHKLSNGTGLNDIEWPLTQLIG